MYVGLFLVSITLAILGTLQLVNLVSMPKQLEVGLIATIGASVTAIGAGVLFALNQKITSFLPGYLVYIALTIIIALTVQQTGGVNSFYLAAWSLMVIFAPLFGAYGALPILVMVGSYVAGAYLTGEFTTQLVILVILSSLVPLAVGMFVWRDASGTENPSEKNVRNLASQLSEVATKSEIVINAIGDGVIAIDGQGVIQLINPAAQEILGWGKQDALMLNYKSILKLADENNNPLDQAGDPVQQVLNTNQQTRGNHLIAVTQSAKKINVSLVVSPIGDPGAGAIVVFRDVTKERSEEREQAEFISTASHEMRTPVASIEGYLGLALNPNTAQIDQKARDFIMKAHEAAQHLGRLFQDLLDVSKSEDGRMTNAPKVIDLVNLAQTITQGLTQKATEKGLKLVFQPTDASAQKKIMPVYFVNQDNDHIREILDNLIENAIKYTPEGSVVVDVNGTENKVIVSIKDTGLGIPPEDLPHLFQKFYRVNNADRQAIGGTGLGLYLARRLAEAMQGRLWVESVFGQGSTFLLELPRVESSEVERLKAQQAQQAQADAQPNQPSTATQIPITVVSSDNTSQADQTSQAAANPAPTAASEQQVTPGIPTDQASLVAPQILIQAPTAQAAPPAQVPARDQPPAPNNVRPATTVPRGESLTREQIAERVKQLEALAKETKAQRV